MSRRLGVKTSNVKRSRKYERFGENIRYFTVEEWRAFLDAVDDYKHKLMMRLIYESGCRVGEFVRIQLKYLDFGRSCVLFPAANTKTRQRRTSHVPKGLMNEIQSLLRSQGRMKKRDNAIKAPETYLFSPDRKGRKAYTENRIRQIFRQYVKKAGLDREYGADVRGRRLHKFTIHSLRHSHIMHYIHVHKLPVPIVQKQVGHKTLQATSVYCRPSDEMVAEAYSRISLTPTNTQKVP